MGYSFEKSSDEPTVEPGAENPAPTTDGAPAAEDAPAGEKPEEVAA